MRYSGITDKFYPQKQMSTPKNSQLIQQLCKHIATIEQLNVKLHEQISQFDCEKETVYRALGKGSWQELLRSVEEEKGAAREVLQNTSSTCRSGIDGGGMDRTGFGFCRTPGKENKIGYQSAFESPIESQSRLANRSIRGDTDREAFQTPLLQPQPQPLKQNLHLQNQNLLTLRQPLNKSPSQVDNFLLTLNKIAGHSTSKSSLDPDLKNTEQQNILLSIENTKLRQRVAKLQAIVASRQYY